MAEQLTLCVTGMTCGGCENAIKRVLSMVDGVSSATASHRTGEVTVVYDPARADRAQLTQAIVMAGYEVV